MRRVWIALLAVTAVSCSAPPPSASPHAAELEALEKGLGAPRPRAATPSSNATPSSKPPTPVDASPAPVRPPFTDRAAETLRIIDTQVKDASAPYERLEADAAAARRSVNALDVEATTAAERNVTYLLDAIVTAEADFRTMASVKPRDPSVGLPPVYAQTARISADRSAECRTELSAWLAVARGAAPAGRPGPCLQRVTEGRKFLNQRQRQP